MASSGPHLPSFLLIFPLLISCGGAPANTAPSSERLAVSQPGPYRDGPHRGTEPACGSAPYPNACSDAVKLSISITISPGILTYLLRSLQTAQLEAGKLSGLLGGAGARVIVEKQRGAIQDCRELSQITVSSLSKTFASIGGGISSYRKLADARAFLSAALTNQVTCLEGLDSASGSLKPLLVNSLTSTYNYVKGSLSLLPGPPAPRQGRRRRLLATEPRWLSRADRRILEGVGEYSPGLVLTVAKDGTGNFTTVTGAVDFAPNNSASRIVIYVKEGLYEETVEIPPYKPNIVMLGDGSDVTAITGNRSVGDGWTTFRSATVAVSGQGFLARGITFMNSAGPEKHQAVALRISADLSAVYRCAIIGYQDSLYIHSLRQFYRECDIFGTIDYIFGNAAAIFQGSNIVSRLPMPGQFTVVTAQSRDLPDEGTGISIQNCSILATDDLSSNSTNSTKVKSYLGRPWKVYSRTVIMNSYIDGFIDPLGWTEWSGNQGLDTLYYGEYNNYGPGSSTDNRVTWPGYHVMDYDDASNFTVYPFINGDEWLDSTNFPYDEGV